MKGLEMMKSSAVTRGMGSHQQTVGRTNDWLTPPEILSALGTFNLLYADSVPLSRQIDNMRLPR